VAPLGIAQAAIDHASIAHRSYPPSRSDDRWPSTAKRDGVPDAGRGIKPETDRSRVVTLGAHRASRSEERDEVDGLIGLLRVDDQNDSTGSSRGMLPPS
jgi:hypothetical protein